MAYVFVGEPLMKDKEWKVKSGGGCLYLFLQKNDEINSKIDCCQNNSVTFAAL